MACSGTDASGVCYYVLVDSSGNTTEYADCSGLPSCTSTNGVIDNEPCRTVSLGQDTYVGKTSDYRCLSSSTSFAKQLTPGGQPVVDAFSAWSGQDIGAWLPPGNVRTGISNGTFFTLLAILVVVFVVVLWAVVE